MEVRSYLSKSHERRKKRRKYIAIGIACVCVYLIAIGAFWFIYRSPLFHLQHVIIQGDADVASSDAIAVLQSAALRDRNFFKELLGYQNILLWPNTFATSDLALMPTVQSGTISKNYFFRTITVDLTAREPAGIWCFMPRTDQAGNPVGDESCYWFDGQGTMFQRAFDTQGDAVLAVHDYDYAAGAGGIGKKVLPDAFIANLMSVLNAIKASGIDAREIALNDMSLEQINVTMRNGPAIYFSIRFSADEDLPVLKSIMAQTNFSKLQYVDFTVENRAYYK